MNSHEPILKLTILLVIILNVSACAHKKVRPKSPQVSILESYDIDQLLIYHEGLKLKPYMDGRNKLTIGAGRNLEDLGISKEEALLLLHNDIDRVGRELDKSLPWWRKLSDVRQKVLISMAFNLGMGRLLQFNRMLSALQDGDYTAAAEEMLSSLWAKQVGTRAIELADMMENG